MSMDRGFYLTARGALWTFNKSWLDYWMDRWMDGWMDGWMDRQMDE